MTCFMHGCWVSKVEESHINKVRKVAKGERGTGRGRWGVRREDREKRGLSKLVDSSNNSFSVEVLIGKYNPRNFQKFQKIRFIRKLYKNNETEVTIITLYLILVRTDLGTTWGLNDESRGLNTEWLTKHCKQKKTQHTTGSNTSGSQHQNMIAVEQNLSVTCQDFI